MIMGIVVLTLGIFLAVLYAIKCITDGRIEVVRLIGALGWLTVAIMIIGFIILLVT